MSKKIRPMVVANWKMHGSCDFVDRFTAVLRDRVASLKAVDIVLCPPALYLSQLAKKLHESGLLWGAQNAYCALEGAYTGEISPSMLREFGCSHVILGHSERRQYFDESNDLVAKKSRFAYDAGLVPIVCIGETRAEREAGQTFEVLKRQLEPVLCEGFDSKTSANLKFERIIAYEPVWAIGTGLTATPEQVQEVHAFIRSFAASCATKTSSTNGFESSSLRILYGGSVKPNNAAGLFEQPDVNGGLIGGASLKVEDFIEICRQATVQR